MWCWKSLKTYFENSWKVLKIYFGKRWSSLLIIKWLNCNFYFCLPVISVGAEAGGPAVQTQHLRGIRTGQLRRPVHQRAHPAHAWRRVTNRFLPSPQLTCPIVWTCPSHASRLVFRDVVRKIDQSEFEGFEYINPLLMSAEECVWETLHLSPWTPPTCKHTLTHTLTPTTRVYAASPCCMRDDPATSFFSEGLTCTSRALCFCQNQSHSAIYNHLSLSLPCFLDIFYII